MRDETGIPVAVLYFDANGKNAFEVDNDTAKQNAITAKIIEQTQKVGLINAIKKVDSEMRRIGPRVQIYDH